MILVNIPFFAGPIFLHGNSDFQTYAQYFQHLAICFACTDEFPVTGSDDERAMSNAMDLAFPGRKHLTCTRHLRTNTKNYLSDKIGLKSSDRNKILDAIFGPAGMVNADDSVSFEVRQDRTEQLLDSIAPTFKRYFTTRIVPILIQNKSAADSNNLINASTQWTNNNCKSFNHVLKQTVDWKPQSLPSLVEKLHTVIIGQYNDIERAIIGRGNFTLHPAYANFAVHQSKWITLDEQRRKRHMQRFLKKIREVNVRVSNSTDGKRWENMTRSLTKSNSRFSPFP